ncbi:hypothetical protein NPIL_53161 [Nephila pilipes]|uniref:Uncharacterized protein n=1 Tax=Nephila pilipes TaxID=299642 RepID=A0A8X6TR46_NEPPI|nr:hypothetical protein NPIL_53161 [Nephila pilipes]
MLLRKREKINATTRRGVPSEGRKTTLEDRQKRVIHLLVGVSPFTNMGNIYNHNGRRKPVPFDLSFVNGLLPTKCPSYNEEKEMALELFWPREMIEERLSHFIP